MIQDIAPRHLNNHYDPNTTPAPEDFVLCLRQGDLLTGGEEGFPRVRELPEGTPLTYLFSIDEERYFLLQKEDMELEGYGFISLRKLRADRVFPKYRLYAAMTGKHLADWYRDFRFCGRCGQPMVHHEKERAMKCACGYTAYPRIMPAVIVGVTDGDKLLLTRYRVGYGYNALVAGFTEIGETLEETVAREVMEETGLRVKNIRYYKSQPWGIANDILMGYFCDVDGSTDILMDTDELSRAVWTPRKEIVLQPDEVSLTNEMMMIFRDGAKV